MFHWYGLIVGIAAIAGWSVAEKIEPKVNKVLLWVLIGGFVGARLYHVIDLWSYYGQNLAQIVAVWNGGLGIFGGIIGGGIGLYIGTRKQELESRMKVLAAMVTGLPLAQAIGRWGNFANHELLGKNGEPLFLYESLLDLLLFGIIWRMRLRGSTPKCLVGIYFFGYGLIRLILEPFKPNPWWLGYAIATIFLSIGAIMSYSQWFYKKIRG